MTQSLALMMGVPSKELTDFLDGGVWSVIELYDKLVAQLGGQHRKRLPPYQLFVLSLSDEHLNSDQKRITASQLSASE